MQYRYTTKEECVLDFLMMVCNKFILGQNPSLKVNKRGPKTLSILLEISPCNLYTPPPAKSLSKSIYYGIK